VVVGCTRECLEIFCYLSWGQDKRICGGDFSTIIDNNKTVKRNQKKNGSLSSIGYSIFSVHLCMYV